MDHHVKCLMPFFGHVLDGHKTFELRRDDRNYQPGDTIVLREVYDAGEVETGRTCERRINYKLLGGQWGLAKGYCVLGLQVVAPTPMGSQAITWDDHRRISADGP